MVFFGLIFGHSFGPPSHVPTNSAKVSEPMETVNTMVISMACRGRGETPASEIMHSPGSTMVKSGIRLTITSVRSGVSRRITKKITVKQQNISTGTMASGRMNSISGTQAKSVA